MLGSIGRMANLGNLLASLSGLLMLVVLKSQYSPHTSWKHVGGAFLCWASFQFALRSADGSIGPVSARMRLSVAALLLLGFLYFFVVGFVAVWRGREEEGTA